MRLGVLLLLLVAGCNHVPKAQTIDPASLGFRRGTEAMIRWTQQDLR